MKIKNGFSLVELIVTIVIISITFVVFFSAIRFLNIQSTNPNQQKQMFFIAQSFMEEIYIKPTTKPTDGFTGPFTSSNRSQFDSVSDYNGYNEVGIVNLLNQPIPQLSNYSVSITVSPITLNPGAIPSFEINITVNHIDPNITPLNMKGYKVQYE